MSSKRIESSHEPSASVGEKVRRLRKARGLSQADLSSISGISQTTISDLERGRNETSKELPAIAAALRVSVEELTYGVVAVTTQSLEGLFDQIRQIASDGLKLSLDERELLQLYQCLSVEERREMLAYARFKASRT